MVRLLRRCHSCDRFPATLREVAVHFDEDSHVAEISSSEDFDSECKDDESDD